MTALCLSCGSYIGVKKIIPSNAAVSIVFSVPKAQVDGFALVHNCTFDAGLGPSSTV